jgi:HSP20 family protein
LANIGLTRRTSHEIPHRRTPLDVGQFFEEFLGGHGAGRWSGDRQVSIPLEVRENDKAIIVSAELPGVDEKSIKVTLTDDLLTIRGEKSAEDQHGDAGVFMAERIYGSFSRSIRLPNKVSADTVEARFKNGVVTITLPTPKEVQEATKDIQVKVAA